MADMSKAEKLAIARRKLKEYQKKEKDAFKKGTSKQLAENGHDASIDNPSSGSMPEILLSKVQNKDLSTQRSENIVPCKLPDASEPHKYGNEHVNNSVERLLSPQLSDANTSPQPVQDISGMFVGSNMNNNNKEASTFFDNIAVSNEVNDNYGAHSFFAPVVHSTEEGELSDRNTEILKTHVLPTFFENHVDTNKFDSSQSRSEFLHMETKCTTQEVFSDNSSVQKTQIPENVTTPSQKCSLPTLSVEQVCSNTNFGDKSDNVSLEQSCINTLEENFLVETDVQNNTERFQGTGMLSFQPVSDSTFLQNVSTKGPHSNSVSQPLTLQTATLSSTESLRQMSLQLNDLIGDNFDHGDDGKSNVSKLEQRNQELVAILGSEQQKNEQLLLQLKEYQSRVSQLELDLNQMQTESEGRLTREIGPLQEQLQLHVQTVGILVGEKTELQSALSKSQQLAKQKAGEAEELQGRLKASRHKVAELEKELSVTVTSKQQLEVNLHQLTSDHEKLQSEYNTIKKQLEEVEEETSENRQKLSTKVKEISALQQELQEKHSQLSLMQLRVQQLSMADNPELDRQLEALHQQKISLEHQVVELKQTVRLVTTERDQASQQYQQYVQQLNSQLQSLASKLETTVTEKESLLAREQSLIQHVSELEKQLQQQQQQLVLKQRDLNSNSEDSAKIQELENRLSAMEEEKQILEDKEEALQKKVEELNVELVIRSKRIEDLESFVDSMKGDQPDKDRLLAAMESDKVAASRAVAQNKKLKQQLEELQQGFVNVSNDKLDLTEKLQHEQHLHREKSEKLQEMENEIQNLRKQFEEKQTSLQQKERLIELESTDPESRVNGFGSLKCEDATEAIFQQFESAKVNNDNLKTYNTELCNNGSLKHNPDSSSVNEKSEIVSSLSSTVEKLQAERDALLAQLKEASVKRDAGFSENQKTSEVHCEHETMKEAMEKLQAKFKKTMEEIAELSDEKQRLEHLVLQLQSETETIGEYIALYQTQRSILRQRAKENDEQLARVSKDREEMKMKLQQLNQLVKRLVNDKDVSLQHDQDFSGENEKVLDKLMQNTGPVSDNDAVSEFVSRGDSTAEQDKCIITPSPDGLLNEVNNKAATAEKIMALLSEIGSSNLVEPQGIENFHPCPWCSGRLITV